MSRRVEGKFFKIADACAVVADFIYDALASTVTLASNITYLPLTEAVTALDYGHVTGIPDGGVHPVTVIRCLPLRSGWHM